MLLFSHRNKNSNQTDLNIPVFLIRNYIPNNYDEYLEAPGEQNTANSPSPALLQVLQQSNSFEWPHGNCTFILPRSSSWRKPGIDS